MCAGITTYNALRHSDAKPGDVVGIQALGGLGHLGVQFARAMGFEVVAVSRGREKESFARELGAHHYIDSSKENLGERFAKLGGAKVILATGPNAAAISTLVAGLGVNGTLLVVAAPFEPLTIHPLDLLTRRAKVQGWPSGTSSDSAATLAFAQRHGIRPRIEVFPLADANRGFEKMMDGSVRFRSVLQVA
jgi:D-arabinose 1-dehydrogenase-like Zn-dependent alcohol dehydrogenase